MSHVRTGVVLILDDKFWGVVYQEANFTSWGWGSVRLAKIDDPNHCKKPTDMMSEDSMYAGEMNKGQLVKIKVTTTYEVERPV